MKVFPLFLCFLVLFSGCMGGGEDDVTSTTTLVSGVSWWRPEVGASWQWQLTGELNSSHGVDVYDIDLFDTSRESIGELHDKGIRVVCCFSAGSWEDWRSDSGEFPVDVLGEPLDDWSGERWLNIRELDKIGPIMESRLDYAASKGCDGVEPDNVDGYANDNGFQLTYEDQLEYNIWLALEAHKRGLAIALKNDLEQIPDLVDYFDFAVNEQCFEYNECSLLQIFIGRKKAVFGVEYNLDPKEFCEKAVELEYSWLSMKLELDGGRIACIQ